VLGDEASVLMARLLAVFCDLSGTLNKFVGVIDRLSPKLYALSKKLQINS
jgi:hypothetical protein